MSNNTENIQKKGVFFYYYSYEMLPFMILSFLAVSILVVVESDRKYKDINYVSLLLFVVRLLMQHESFFDCKLLTFCCFVLIDIKLINLLLTQHVFPPATPAMDRVDSWQVPVFQTTSLQTVIAPGTSQYLLGISLKSPSTASLWIHLTVRTVAECLVAPVFSSLMSLLMMETRNSVVQNFLIQCTLSEILSK